MMGCRDLVEATTEYLEGALPEPDRARFEAHLTECPHCGIHLQQMRETIAALGELREPSLSPKTRETLLDAFRGWRGSPG
jgi:anti-sigma factor RsiW